MSPRGPNEKIIAIAVVNGGETSGSSTLASTMPSSQRGSRPRAAVNANRKPSDRPGDADQRGEQQAVPERADLMPVGQDRGDAGGRERAVIGQHPREQHRERIDDEKRRAAATAPAPPRRRRGPGGRPRDRPPARLRWRRSRCLLTDSGLPRSSDRRCASGSRPRSPHRWRRSSRPSAPRRGSARWRPPDSPARS